MTHIFGIRHHGPGSAKRLNQALEQLQPDFLLIEGPADIDKELDYVLHPDMVPPVALVIYNPKDFSQASYLPFAEFSPEWQAIRFGLSNEIPIRFMDLPMSMQFTLDAEAKQQFDFEKPVKFDRAQLDPMGFIAELAGYPDSERWWEVTFEQERDDVAVFEQILELMQALRTELDREERLQTLRREAYMRKIIRETVKAGAKKIAIVCGAWHAPALAEWQTVKQTADNQLLKGIKKTKVESTWIPWTYERLAFQSGYRAGVLSPAWYELLFDRTGEEVVYWMAKVSSLLRQEDLEASAAHVMEAVRLAETLATLRRKKLPGIEELEEAALTVFAQGAKSQLDLIRDRLVIGRVVGQVPAKIPTMPLQKDVEQQIKSARLTKDRDTAGPVEKTLDVRKPANLLASLLLHRLQLLGIPWGVMQAGSENALGSFKEHWLLHWQPEYTIKIIEKGMWGNTLENACVNYILDQANDVNDLPKLTQLTSDALKADLQALIPNLVQRLQRASVLTKDVQFLMQAFPTLVKIIRYGNTRKTDVRSVEHLVDQLAPRIGIGLPKICLQIEEEVARDIFDQALQMNHSLALLSNPRHQQAWNQALLKIANDGQCHSLLRGAASRLLFDQEYWTEEETARRMSFALSDYQVEEVVLWLEGFLYGSGLVLVHHYQLWAILDDWVKGLPMTTFVDVLPLLRRAFANYSEPERQQLLRLARGIQKKLTDQPLDESLELSIREKLDPMLEQLLRD